MTRARELIGRGSRATACCSVSSSSCCGTWCLSRVACDALVAVSAPSGRPHSLASHSKERAAARSSRTVMMPAAPTAVPLKATSREWLGLAVLALPCLLYSMDLTVLHLAIPKISADLRPTSAQLLWIIDIYGFLVAGCLITMGTLGDRFGRRKVLLAGAAAFGLCSVAAAFAPTAEALIASRALLGIAGATLAPSTLSLIFAMFEDPRERTAAIGVWISSFSAGSAIGPVLGGVLLEHFWW